LEKKEFNLKNTRRCSRIKAKSEDKSNKKVMKKFSAEYFEKKYRILFNKLLLKKEFLDTVKELRNKLGLPEKGFENEVELSRYFIGKMDEKTKNVLKFATFADDYYHKNAIDLDEKGSKEKILIAYQERIKNKKIDETEIIFRIAEDISDHNQMITKDPFFKKNKYLSKLHPETLKLIRKFWNFDLLDEHIMGHFVEKYLFLGDYGINQYIKSKIACPNCRYIGVNHFSPIRSNMKGGSEGANSKDYIFNEHTVRLLSLYFNCVFLIIEPYATKEEVLQYIEDNWNNLKEHIIEKNSFYKQFDVHPSKIKESNFERNQLIYELYKLSKKELLKKYKGEQDFSLLGIYKETIISAILREQYKIDILPEAVKKSATRFAKNTNTQKKMKDIRDI